MITMTRKKTLPLVKGRAREALRHLSPLAGRRRPREARAGGVFRTRHRRAHPDPPAASGRQLLRARAETAALYRLMAWLSPSYPVGAFSYSSGIEWAVEAGDIADAASLKDWLRR